MTTSSKDTLDLTWKNAVGFAKLQGFFNFLTAGGKFDDLNQGEYTYLSHYASRYGLLTPTFTLTATGSALAKANPSKLAATIVTVLKGNTLGHGCWVFAPTAFIKNDSYVFECTGTGESSYQYALFLSDLGVISEEESWAQDGRIFSCPLTDCGQRVIQLLIPPISSNSSEVVSDGHVPPSIMFVTVQPGGTFENKQIAGNDSSTNVFRDNNGVMAGGERTEATMNEGGDRDG